jgi:acetolactate synthase-1/2/3 large subunit
LPTYDALSPYEAEGKIHHVLVRHEQCAAHMADGYARATGEVGVCIATSGPGATNLVTGLATAQMDSVPIVAITGQVPTNLLGTDAFQEADVVGVTAPVCKHNYLVTDVNELPLILKEAFYIAREGALASCSLTSARMCRTPPVCSAMTSRSTCPASNPGRMSTKKQCARRRS